MPRHSCAWSLGKLCLTGFLLGRAIHSHTDSAAAAQVAGLTEPQLEAWLKNELILGNVRRLAEHGLVSGTWGDGAAYCFLRLMQQHSECTHDCLPAVLLCPYMCAYHSHKWLPECQVGLVYLVSVAFISEPNAHGILPAFPIQTGTST